jgi:hypothetical protein
MRGLGGLTLTLKYAMYAFPEVASTPMGAAFSFLKYIPRVGILSPLPSFSSTP